MLKSLFRKSPDPDAVAALYRAIVAQARQPAFYRDCGVPDSVDGRFDMVALHAFLVLRRLRDDGAGSAAMSQALFDHMFDDMDRSLREMGAGDLGVGRRVKAMARAFYGRAAAYDEGIEGDAGVLEAALARNLYRGNAAGAAPVAALAAYVMREAQTLAARTAAEIVDRGPRFGPPPGADPSGSIPEDG